MASRSKKRKNKETPQPLKKRSYKKAWLLIIISGFLSFLIHPTIIDGFHFPNLSILAWVYLVPLIMALEDNKPLSLKKVFLFCFTSGAIGFYGLLFWLVTAMKTFGGMNTFEAWGSLSALVFMFSFFFAAFFTVIIWIRKRTLLPYFLILPVFLTLRDIMVLYFPFGGFPYGMPPYSQGSWISLFQWVDHTGVLGLSLFIYIINGLFADTFVTWKKFRKLHRAIIIYASAIIILWGLSLTASTISLKHYEANKKLIKQIKVGFLQGNIPQDVKWNPKLSNYILKKYSQMTDTAAEKGVDLILWPETSYSKPIYEKHRDKFKFLDRDSLKTPMLVGTLLVHGKKHQRKIFNSVIQIDKSSSIRAAYKKIHLVPFGEYLPFKEYLGFMEGLTQGVGFFSPGKDYVVFDVLDVKWAALICFEDIFSRYTRRFAQRGTQIFINFTNDSWYGDSSMQPQHVTYDQFRALENRLPLIRSTNTGITAVLDSTGKVLIDYPAFTEGVFIYDVKIEIAPSFYTKHGEPWIVAVFIISLGIIIYALMGRKPSRSPQT